MSRFNVKQDATGFDKTKGVYLVMEGSLPVMEFFEETHAYFYAYRCNRMVKSWKTGENGQTD